jgi:hypothetical protein
LRQRLRGSRAQQGIPFTQDDGLGGTEIVPDRLSLSLEQAPDDAGPQVWLSHGDVCSDETHGAHHIELTLAEASELMLALARITSRARQPGTT